MKLQLSIVSYQRALLGDSAVRVFDAVGGTIGRAAGNDWVLEDSSRVLSARHAILSYDAPNGRYLIADVSTNGVFLNDADEPLGRGRSAVLQNGDRITIGDYELAVAIRYADARPPAPRVDPIAALDRAGVSSVRPQAVLPDEWDPAALLARPADTPAPASAPAPVLPADFDPLVVIVPPPPAKAVPPSLGAPAPGRQAAGAVAVFDPAALAERWGLDDPAALWTRFVREYPVLALEAAAIPGGNAGGDGPQ